MNNQGGNFPAGRVDGGPDGDAGSHDVACGEVFHGWWRGGGGESFARRSPILALGVRAISAVKVGGVGL